MRLDNTRPQGRKPMRTVSEIAEILGIATTKLSHALRKPDAPKGMTAKSLGHNVAGKNRVWYEPGAVIRWYRSSQQTDTKVDFQAIAKLPLEAKHS